MSTVTRKLSVSLCVFVRRFIGEVSFAMLIPVIGMILGLLTAVFVTYRKPREYVVTTAEPTTTEIKQHIANIKPIQITASAVAIVATFATQLF